MGTVNMSIRMDSELKKQAEVMLSDMGLNMTTAMAVTENRQISTHKSKCSA